MTVLPGQRLMLEGRGIEAVRLSALGSAGSVLFAILLIIPLSWIVSSYYDYLTKYVGILLLAIALMMIKSERGPWIEGQGSWVHWKYKAVAALLFLTSGLLGIFAFDHEDLASSPLGLEPQVLLPLLSGIFGASSLLLSLSTETEIPEQKESEIKLSSSALAKAVFSGGLGGSVVAWIPGVSPSVAAITARLGAIPSPEEFLVSIAGVNTANALFSLVALYVIDKPRSGAAAAIQELMALDQSILVQMIIIVVIVAAASYLACIGCGAPGRAGHIPAQLPAALPGGAGLFGGHDLRLYGALRAVHLLPVHGGGPDCAGGGNSQDACHGGADAAADFEVYLVEKWEIIPFTSRFIIG